MAQNWEAHFSKGTTAARPAANTLPKGAIYWSTDDHKFFVGAGVANTWADFTATLALFSDIATAIGATKLDDLATPDDNTDLNASTSRHGLLKKLSNVSTEFMNGQGNWATPAGGGGGSGALTLLESHTASSSATLDFTTRNASGQSGATFQSDYDEYELHLLKLVPATNAVQLWGRVSSNGGSSFIAADYATNDWRYVAAGSAQAGTTAAAQLYLLGGGITTDSLSNNANWGVSGRYTIVDPLSTTQMKQFYGQTRYLNNGSVREGAQVAASYDIAATAINAFQLLMSSGNIASGIARLYGVAK